MGEGGCSEDVEPSITSAAREHLASALRGLRCIPISEMGKLRSLLRTSPNQDPRPHQTPAVGQVLCLAGRGF